MQGVQGTSVADLIAASHTSAGAIYHHFGSKNAVIVEVARQALDWPQRSLAAYRSSPRSPAELLEFAVGALQFAPELGDLLLQLGAGAATDDELGSVLRAEFANLKNDVDLTVRAWAQQESIEPERTQGIAQLLVGLVLGFAAQRRLVADLDETRYLSLAQQLLYAQTPPRR